MKKIVEFFNKKRSIFKKLEKIDNRLLETKKRIEIYDGVDLKSYYYCIFYSKQKSRFVVKNANDLEDLFIKVISLKKHNYKKKILLIECQICSKAKKYLEEKGWKIYVFV